DMKELQADTVLVSAREVAPLILEAFRHHPPTDPTVARAVKLLEGWNGDMATSSGAAALFAGFLKRLFGETFADELGDDLVRGYLAHANVWAIMLTAALEGNGRWFDRVGTREVESRDLVLRASVEKAVADLIPLLGADPTGWTWGRIHTLELQHPLARGGGALGLYFNRGPFSLPGHNQTVNKGEFGPEGFAVLHGPSMRQITDFSDLNRSLAVLPGGQSGIPASPHYDDMTSSWLAGRYHPVPMDRAAVEAVLEGRLVLVPGS
ncbi:MAG TPA: penicillin acylase family protein, partial [Vicinamibacteria bacterium]